MNKTLNRLNSMISDVYTAGEPQITMDLMNNLLCLMSQDSNLSPLAGGIIKLLPTPNVMLKKVICSYLIRYSESISDLSLLTTNTLRKDFSDPNPSVRKLVIRTVCSIPSLRDLALELLPMALKDPSVHVRRTATVSCSKVITITSDCSDLIDQLYRIVRDDDPLVVSNALVALDEILEPEGGIVIKPKMAQYLMRRLISFPDWCVSSVCGILKNYEPKSEDESLLFLNILDSTLGTRNSLVLLSSMDLTLTFAKKLNRDLEKDIVQRVLQSLLLVIDDSSPEILYTIIEHTQHLIFTYKDIFSDHYNRFLCNFNDPVYLKIKKLQTLSLLLQNNNCSDIAEDAIDHLTDCREISQQAIETFVHILNFEDMTSSHRHIKILLQLMTSEHSHIIEDVVTSLSGLDLQKFGDSKKSILSAISECHQKICSYDAKKALLCIICNHGENIDNIAYILEEMIGNESNTADEVICSFLLTASMKIFFIQPAQMQLLLGKFLDQAKNSPFAVVRSQALFYNSLLQIDLEVAAKIMECHFV